MPCLRSWDHAETDRQAGQVAEQTFQSKGGALLARLLAGSTKKALSSESIGGSEQDRHTSSSVSRDYSDSLLQAWQQVLNRCIYCCCCCDFDHFFFDRSCAFAGLGDPAANQIKSDSIDAASQYPASSRSIISTLESPKLPGILLAE